MKREDGAFKTILNKPVTAPATVGEGWVIAATVPDGMGRRPGAGIMPFVSPETGPQFI